MAKLFFGLFFCSCVLCMHMYVCFHMCQHTRTCIHAYRDKRLVLHVSIGCAPACGLRRSLSIEATNSATVANQHAPGTPPLLPSQHKHSLLPGIYVGAGGLISGLITLVQRLLCMLSPPSCPLRGSVFSCKFLSRSIVFARGSCPSIEFLLHTSRRPVKGSF